MLESRKIARQFYLTLTRVVFEYNTFLFSNLKPADLTLTRVVFELNKAIA